jgi:hypothetical protein
MIQERIEPNQNICEDCILRIKYNRFELMII